MHIQRSQAWPGNCHPGWEKTSSTLLGEAATAPIPECYAKGRKAFKVSKGTSWATVHGVVKNLPRSPNRCQVTARSLGSLRRRTFIGNVRLKGAKKCSNPYGSHRRRRAHRRRSKWQECQKARVKVMKKLYNHGANVARSTPLTNPAPTFLPGSL
jgi:hypothetical protein